MSCFRRWGLPALLLSLPVLALSGGPLRAELTVPPPGLDGKAVDAVVFKTLREVINEGADMYNAKGKYENQERDYLGCYHFYEGALIATRPLLSAHLDLQKLIDDGLDDAAKTPRAEMRAFVLRAVIDKIRDGLKGDQTAVTPPSPPKETTKTGKVVRMDKNKLTVSVDGKEQSVTVPPDARVVIDGKDGKIEDVKTDGTATVTLKDDVVTKVDVKNPLTPPPPTETKRTGKATGMENGKLLMKGSDNTTWVVKVPTDVLIDGKPGKAEDIKNDSSVTITVTYDPATKTSETTKIEAKSPPPPPVKETTATGKATKVEKGKLTLKDDEGKEKNFTIPETARLTIDGKEGKLEDVKNDSTVTVTSKGEEVTKVDVKAPAAPPVKETTAAGKVTKLDKDKLTLKDDAGKEKSFSIPETAKLTIDGKEGKIGDIKPDSSATITSKGEEVTKVDVKGPTAPPPPPPPPTPQTLWDRLGGEANVAKVVDDFVNTAGKDPKVNFFRDPTVTPTKEEMASLKKKLVEFVSSATGGPLKYDGKSMKDAHKGMTITDEEFDASVADLKAALEKNGAKADDVKAVLTAVEGTRKDIVEAKKPEDKDKPPAKDKPAPADKDKPAPLDKDKPAPADKDKPAPLDKDKPAPADKDKPAPLDKDKPAPADKDKPAPLDKDKPAPADKDKPAPADKDKPAPADKDKANPTDKPSDAGAVDGKVSYKGKPVTGGVVGLTDADGKTIKADLAADGTYKVEAVKPGKYKVTLNTEGLNDPAKPNPAYVPVPAKYREAETTPLVVEVRKGDQTLDLNLE